MYLPLVSNEDRRGYEEYITQWIRRGELFQSYINEEIYRGQQDIKFAPILKEMKQEQEQTEAMAVAAEEETTGEELEGEGDAENANGNGRHYRNLHVAGLDVHPTLHEGGIWGFGDVSKILFTLFFSRTSRSIEPF